MITEVQTLEGRDCMYFKSKNLIYLIDNASMPIRGWSMSTREDAAIDYFFAFLILDYQASGGI